MQHGFGRLMDAKGTVLHQGTWYEGVFLGADFVLPERPQPVAPLEISAGPANPICSAEGHAYRRRWTGCSYLFCLLGCCYCALMQRTRVCKTCGHRSD